MAVVDQVFAGDTEDGEKSGTDFSLCWPLEITD